MNNLRNLKEERSKIADIHKITSSLQMVASTQSAQFIKRKKNHAPILEYATKMIKFVANKLTYDLSNTLHIILSCDQKFCKNFLVNLHLYLSELKFNAKEQIMLFGNRSTKVVEELTSPDMIDQYKALTTFDDCESIAVYIKSIGYPVTYIHAYSEAAKAFQRTKLVPFDTESAEPKDAQDPEAIVHLYLASHIYSHVLQTGLKERIDRATAMSEASENAQTKARQLLSEYNKTRQAMITKEITSGS